jgi:molybdopterin-synthase adenylyltransferase
MARKVVIVGAGALGSHVLLLARNWDCELILIDFDKVEQKNTQAQMHTRMSLRRNKAQAMQQAMQGMWGLKVKAVPHRLTMGNFKQLLDGAFLVIDCTDNIEARQILKAAKVVLPKMEILHGALSAGGDFARVVWTENFTPDAEGGEGEATCEDGENLHFHALAAAHMTREVQTFLAGGKKRSWQITPTSVLRIA